MIDSILDKPVEESIVNDLEYDTVKSFIEKAINGKPVHAITTDHRLEYKSIMDELKINHQLCIFHLLKSVFLRPLELYLSILIDKPFFIASLSKVRYIL